MKLPYKQTDKQTNTTNQHTYLLAKMVILASNKQTDRQTSNKHDQRTSLPKCKFWQVITNMKGQSEIAYLPKFANMFILLIVLVIVIIEIL